MNTALANNVVGLNNSSAESTIERFLNKYNRKNTITTYRQHFNKMFMYTCGKKIEDITKEDLKSINITKIREYIDFLKNSNYEESTINQSILSCSTLWQYLEKEDLVIKDYFKKETIKPNKEDEGKNSYGSLTEEELNQLYDYCLSLKDRGLTKKLYFEFLATLTCRKTAAQELRLDNIRRTFNKEDRQYYWVINSFDKTKIINRAISNEFYQRLADNFNSYEYKDREKGLLFNVENQTLEKTLKDFCKEYKIDKAGRNICQHSLKSTGLDIIYDVFNDIKIVAEAGGHSDINTTYKHYLSKQKNYALQPSILLSKSPEDCLRELDQLSKDELINIIATSDKFVAIKLCLKKDGVI